MQVDRIPDHLGPFRVEGEIGRGASAVVLAALREDDGLAVALKVLLPEEADELALGRFLRESELLESIEHPNIVRCHGHGFDSDLHYMVLDLVQGPTFEELLQGRTLSLRDGVEVLAKVARAIDSLHGREIVHRDLKPANILVAEGLEPRVSDLGLAVRLSDPRTTEEGTVLGSVHTLSPEQVEGDPRAVSPRTDVYALGAILYRLLTGRPPYDGGEGAFGRILRGEAPAPRSLNPDAPAALAAACQRALAVDPQARHPTSLELAGELEDWLAHPAAEVVSATTGLDRPGRPRRAPSIPAPPGLASGTRVGGYEVVRSLGAGGMGEVFLAKQPGTGRQVALKVMRVSPSGAKRDPLRLFRRETSALGRLDHPNIVRVHAAGVEGDIAYMAMAHVDGGSLGERLREIRSPQEGIRIVRDAARGAGHAHSLGIVHRDLKPDNLLIDQEGRVQVADFGVARLIGVAATNVSQGTQDGVLVGSPGYASPEQGYGLISKVSPASDVFSLGVVLYEVLTGERPFSGDSLLEVLAATARADPELPSKLRPELGKGIDAVCLKALEKEPEDRYPDGAALAADLDRLLAGDPPLAKRTSTVEAARAFARRWWGWAPVAVTLALAAVVPVFALREEPVEAPSPPASAAPIDQAELARAKQSLARAQRAFELGCSADAVALLEGVEAQGAIGVSLAELRAVAMTETLQRSGGVAPPYPSTWDPQLLRQRALGIAREETALALVSLDAAQLELARRAVDLLASHGGDPEDARSLRGALESGASPSVPPRGLELPGGLGLPRNESSNRAAEEIDEEAKAIGDVGDRERALEIREAGLKQHPRDPWLRLHHAVALARSQRPAEALLETALATAVAPDTADSVPEQVVEICKANGPRAVFRTVEDYPPDPEPAIGAALRVYVAASRLLLGPDGDIRRGLAMNLGMEPDDPLAPVDLEQAHADAQLALARYPSWVALRIFRGLLRLRLGYPLSGRLDVGASTRIARNPRMMRNGLVLSASILASSGQDGAIPLLIEAKRQGVRHRDSWASKWAFESLQDDPRFIRLIER